MSEPDSTAEPRKRRPAAEVETGAARAAMRAAERAAERTAGLEAARASAGMKPAAESAPSAEGGQPADGGHRAVVGQPAAGRHPRALDPSRLSILIVAILAGSALFLGGFSLGSRTATTPGTPASQETRFAAFWDVYSAIDRNFAGSPKPNGDQLVRSAIKGMMESLNDPYSYYEAPDDFAKSVLGVGGRAIGIGVSVQMQPTAAAAGSSDCPAVGNGCELAIVEAIPGSPAESAGLKAGDVIAAVDGTPLAGMSIDQITARIKGDAGTPVKLTIRRGSQTIDVTIIRNAYNLPAIVTRTLAHGSVQYIKVLGINDVASSQFDLALADALAAGRKAIVIDVRDNGGGYVGNAAKIASEFIGSGTILFQQDAAGTQTEIAASPGGRATDPAIKVVVLVNKASASSAEILAGALQTRGRALLVGQTTFGKGVVQEWLPLPNNDGGIHLTIARWLLPNKVWIQGKGLAPDVAATMDGARAGTDPVLDAGLIALGFPAEPGPSPSPGDSASPIPSDSPIPSASAG